MNYCYYYYYVNAYERDCLQQYLSLSPGPIAINSLVYNHNGQLLLTGAADGRIRLYGLILICMISMDVNKATRVKAKAENMKVNF